MFKKRCECFLPAIISIVLGIIVGYLVFNFIIPGLLLAIWVALGISIGALLLIFFAAIQTHGREEWCVGKYGSSIVISAILTMIIVIVGLTLPIITGILSISILVGLGTLFLAYTIFSVAQFLLCLVRVNCRKVE